MLIGVIGAKNVNFQQIFECFDEIYDSDNDTIKGNDNVNSNAIDNLYSQ